MSAFTVAEAIHASAHVEVARVAVVVSCIVHCDCACVARSGSVRGLLSLSLNL